MSSLQTVSELGSIEILQKSSPCEANDTYKQVKNITTDIMN